MEEHSINLILQRNKTKQNTHLSYHHVQPDRHVPELFKLFLKQTTINKVLLKGSPPMSPRRSILGAAAGLAIAWALVDTVEEVRGATGAVQAWITGGVACTA